MLAQAIYYASSTECNNKHSIQGNTNYVGISTCVCFCDVKNFAHTISHNNITYHIFHHPLVGHYLLVHLLIFELTAHRPQSLEGHQ